MYQSNEQDLRTPTERELDKVMARPGLVLDDILHIEVDLRNEMRGLSDEQRAHMLKRLSACAFQLREDRRIADAVMIEMIVRGLERSFR
jgi:hypothetical protein